MRYLFSLSIMLCTSMNSGYASDAHFVGEPMADDEGTVRCFVVEGGVVIGRIEMEDLSEVQNYATMQEIAQEAAQERVQKTESVGN